MNNEKKAISITISDIEDLETIANVLSNIYSTILVHYLETKQDEKTIRFIKANALYFASLCADLGIEAEDFENDY